MILVQLNHICFLLVGGKYFWWLIMLINSSFYLKLMLAFPYLEVTPSHAYMIEGCFRLLAHVRKECLHLLVLIISVQCIFLIMWVLALLIYDYQHWKCLYCSHLFNPFSVENVISPFWGVKIILLEKGYNALGWEKKT